ncbi:hypothetical protein MIND_00260900 [Mycena indigotica]|uniref:Uncharacterized protein n=1 Tax=Mycena indigotica TaxID=2126181 RepID=A0A8H6T7G8_9AGAR|nr:uncharacterized protein MIND_00260900 [Mycena indigotica]KAF7312473.1 hypothetical protein MIND_00260900 [Mycena indigotica]
MAYYESPFTAGAGPSNPATQLTNETTTATSTSTAQQRRPKDPSFLRALTGYSIPVHIAHDEAENCHTCRLQLVQGGERVVIDGYRPYRTINITSRYPTYEINRLYDLTVHRLFSGEIPYTFLMLGPRAGFLYPLDANGIFHFIVKDPPPGTPHTKFRRANERMRDDTVILRTVSGSGPPGFPDFYVRRTPDGRLSVWLKPTRREAKRRNYGNRGHELLVSYKPGGHWQLTQQMGFSEPPSGHWKPNLHDVLDRIHDADRHGPPPLRPGAQQDKQATISCSFSLQLFSRSPNPLPVTRHYPQTTMSSPFR